MLQQVQRIGHHCSVHRRIVEAVPFSTAHHVARIRKGQHLFAIDFTPAPADMIRVEVCEKDRIDIGWIKSCNSSNLSSASDLVRPTTGKIPGMTFKSSGLRPKRAMRPFNLA